MLLGRLQTARRSRAERDDSPRCGGEHALNRHIRCVLSLNLFLLKRFFSRSFFLLFDEPQPRKSSGGDHHHDQNGVLGHRNGPNLVFTDQDCASVSHPVLDSHQTFSVFGISLLRAATVSEGSMTQTTLLFRAAICGSRKRNRNCYATSPN